VPCIPPNDSWSTRRDAQHAYAADRTVAATIPADKALYQRQIEATDEEVDALVYELYGLTEEEIAVVQRSDQ